MAGRPKLRWRRKSAIRRAKGVSGRRLADSIDVCGHVHTPVERCERSPRNELRTANRRVCREYGCWRSAAVQKSTVAAQAQRGMFKSGQPEAAAACHAQGMKPMALVGLVLIVAGIVALIYRGIPYTTTRNGRGHRAHSCHRRARPDAAIADGRWRPRDCWRRRARGRRRPEVHGLSLKPLANGSLRREAESLDQIFGMTFLQREKQLVDQV